MLFTRRSQRPVSEEPPDDILARGEKTVLRPFTRADVDRWIAWPRHSDPLFESYNPPALSERQRDIYAKQYRESTVARQFSIEDLVGDLVGRISLRDIDWRLGAAVLGISFHPQRLGQGLGTDSLRAFLGYYFATMQMNVLFLDVAAFNRRAYRVYEKCGFRPCGRRWGDAQTDPAGIFRRPEYAPLREQFKWEFGLVRPLLIDMALRRDDWLGLRDLERAGRREQPAAP